MGVRLLDVRLLVRLLRVRAPGAGLFASVPDGMASRDAVPDDMVRQGMVPDDMVRQDTAPHHTGPHHRGPHHTGPHHTAPHHTGLHDTGPPPASRRRRPCVVRCPG
ncbi:hypothetical protein GCM10023329_03190 [Streptomyces sanyensis]|uniref:Secreted protein n=1 Tax=Streptomyces sanyensis TaxID=568869 RepID=A0ABP8ZPU2_9ACTN